jgi:hypothetical protein
MTRDEQKRLSDHCRKQLASLPQMPVAVSDMTANELFLFQEFAAPLCGLLHFLADYLDPDLRERTAVFNKYFNDQG